MRSRAGKSITVLLLFSCLLFSKARAQDAWVDTLTESLSHPPKFYLTLTNFSSYISKEVAYFTSLRMGFSFNKRVRFSVGLYSLNSHVVSPIDVQTGNLEYQTNGELHLSFVTWSAEYVFYKNYPWQFSVVPFQLGLGRAHYDYIRKTDTVRTQTASEGVGIFQPEISAQFSIFKWVGLGSTIGYRQSLYSSKRIRQDFNSPVFSFGVRLFLDEIWLALFPKKTAEGTAQPEPK